MKQNEFAQEMGFIDVSEENTVEDARQAIVFGKPAVPSENIGAESQENAIYKDYKSEITEMIKEMRQQKMQLRMEEKKILECIKSALRNNCIKFMCDPELPKIIEVGFGSENKILRMIITVENSSVIYRLAFPYRVQGNTLAIVALYAAQFNENRLLSHMNLTLDDGEITMEYTYLQLESDAFCEEAFMTYLISTVKRAQEVYTKLSHLAVGIVPQKDKEQYKKLLEESLRVLNGEEIDDREIIYGCNDIFKENKSPESFSKILQNLKDDEPLQYDFSLPEPSSNKDKKVPQDYPTLEELIRMQQGLTSTPNGKCEPDKKIDVLSMFEDD